MPSNFLTLPDTANTLSVFYRPGEDIRLTNSNSNSLFTFGDFRIYTDNPSEPLSSETLNIKFDNFSTLETIKGVDLTPPKSYSVSQNELYLNPKDPHSYSYFGSFYTEVANSINNIISNFPYAILVYDGGTGTTIFDYTVNYNNITGEKNCTFKVPYSALTNQGSVVVNSATTVGTYGLASDYTKFSIKSNSLSYSSNTDDVSIIGYSFSSNTIPYLQFSTNNFIDGVNGSTSTIPLYIKPTKERMANYKFTLSELEYNMLYGFKLNTLSAEDDTTEIENNFIWPRNIDGFNPDLYGNAFDIFKKNILKASSDTDDIKTDILVKTVIPENYFELDSDQSVYASLIQTYGHEFDIIKRYIDGIANAHTVTYNKIENVPDKYLKKLSNLLGWKLSDNFNELSLFEYLAGNADSDQNSHSYYNLEIWRRILVNINWLYKRKGTREAIQFIFKLLGAPDSLLKFDEFTYKIESAFYDNKTISNNLGKINENGYIDYDASAFHFQEKGKGRGNGDAYINQWKPEFNPMIQVDNVKIVVADDNVFGSQNIINTKEVNLSIDPAQAIEYDVFNFYQQSGTCWVWGSLAPPFSSLTIPFEYEADCDVIQPYNINSMSFNEYMDYIYTNSIDPRNRKVLGSTDTSSFYPSLRNAYLNYYMWSSPQSNRLTFHKLQPFLDLITTNFNMYVEQLIPATTIFDNTGTVIRNTVFNRQKFVYKPGLNDGSEFRRPIESLEPSIKAISISSSVNDELKSSVKNISITPILGKTINAVLNLTSFIGSINPNSTVVSIPSFSTSAGQGPNGTFNTIQPTLP